MGTKAYGRDMRVARGRLDRRKLGRLEVALLSKVSLGDMLLAHIASPLSLGRSAYLARGFAKERGAAAYKAKRALGRMKKKGLLEMVEGEDGTFVRITDMGAGELRLNVARTSDPKTWDGKWRMVLFDIPDAQTQLRDELRATLQIVGFLRVQNSVYVFPYPVPSLEKEIRDKNLPASQLLFATMDGVVGDRNMRKHFKLALE